MANVSNNDNTVLTFLYFVHNETYSFNMLGFIFAYLRVCIPNNLRDKTTKPFTGQCLYAFKLLTLTSYIGNDSFSRLYYWFSTTLDPLLLYVYDYFQVINIQNRHNENNVCVYLTMLIFDLRY